MIRSLSFLILLAVAANAAAQTVSQQDLEACATIERAAERLDCFEALAARGNALSAVDAQPAIEERGQSERAEPEQEVTADPDRSAGTLSVQPPDADLDRLANAGVEQLSDTRREEVRQEQSDISAEVTDVSEGPRGNLYFHLENGQIWRQIEARYVPLPANAPFSVEISQGILGEYRLRVEGEGRLVRVRRVQ